MVGFALKTRKPRECPWDFVLKNKILWFTRLKKQSLVKRWAKTVEKDGDYIESIE